MDQLTKALFKKLDKKLLALEKELSTLPEAQLAKKPSPTAWSVLDILHHLRMAEAYGHRYTEKKLSFNPSLPDVNWQSQFRAWLLNTFNRSNFKIKAPKGVDEAHFPQDVPLEQIMIQWKNQRNNLHVYLESLDEQLFGKQVYKHPFGGRLSLANMLQFFDSHFDRHYKQIQRTLAAIYSSSSKN